jgi:peptidoglycan/xylan/chitin deacetylase (PgdA/CDA1 family)
MRHKNLTKLSDSEAHYEITEGAAAVATACGASSRFFRFPYGDESDSLLEFARAEKLVVFSWNIDPTDWDFTGRHASSLVNTLKAIINDIETTGAGVMVLHERISTALVLPDLMCCFLERGITLVKFCPE